MWCCGWILRSNDMVVLGTLIFIWLSSSHTFLSSHCPPILGCDTHTRLCLPWIGLPWYSTREMVWSSWYLSMVQCCGVSTEMSWAFHFCVSFVFVPVLLSRGTVWKWGSRISKEILQIRKWEEGCEEQLVRWGTLDASSGSRADVFQSFLSLQTAWQRGNNDFHWLADICPFIHEERKHNEKSWKEKISEVTELNFVGFFFSDSDSRFKIYIILLLR